MNPSHNALTTHLSLLFCFAMLACGGPSPGATTPAPAEVGAAAEDVVDEAPLEVSFTMTPTPMQSGAFGEASWGFVVASTQSGRLSSYGASTATPNPASGITASLLRGRA